MRHLDLFSGIGGFALATEMVFGEVEHIFCDNEPFSQTILKKHWPNAPIYDDIKTLFAARIAADTESKRLGTWRKEPEGEWSGRAFSPQHNWSLGIDLLTGGFPCQPFSSAGRRAGTEDDRHLWPQMLRVIRETRPAFVLGENVGGLLTWDGGLVLEMVIADLEAAGYEAGAFVIPACAIGAPHRRDRVWIAAHAIGRDAGGASGFVRGSEESQRLPERHEMGKPGEPSGIRDARNAEYDGRDGAENGEGNPEGNDRDTARTHELRQPEGADSLREADADTFSEGEGRGGELEAAGQRGKPRGTRSNEGTGWTEDWPQVAARLCTLDDGLPNGLARPKGWRNAALKGAGNAIVPQVAAEVIRAMML